MANKTFDLDDYISQRKEKDSEFAKDFPLITFYVYLGAD